MLTLLEFETTAAHCKAKIKDKKALQEVIERYPSYEDKKEAVVYVILAILKNRPFTQDNNSIATLVLWQLCGESPVIIFPTDAVYTLPNLWKKLSEEEHSPQEAKNLIFGEDRNG